MSPVISFFFSQEMLLVDSFSSLENMPCCDSVLEWRTGLWQSSFAISSEGKPPGTLPPSWARILRLTKQAVQLPLPFSPASLTREIGGSDIDS